MKNIIFLTFFTLIGTIANTQDLSQDFARIINSSISLLGKPTPKNFIRMDRNHYLDSNDVQAPVRTMVQVENNIVILVLFTVYCNNAVVAGEIRGLYYNFLENNNWRYNGTYQVIYDEYFKNGIYARIEKSFTTNQNGVISAIIMFSRE